MNENIIYFIQGGISGVISRTLTSPFERLKILQQNYPMKYNKNTLNSLKYIYIKDGFNGFFYGNLANSLRIFPQNAIQYSVFNILSINLTKYIDNKNIINFSSGSIGGIMSYTSIYPLETIRSKLSAQQNKEKYKNIFDCLNKSIKLYGFKSFYQGMGISIIGYIPYQGNNFLTYYYLKNNYNKNNSKIKSLLFDSISGFSSVSLTYPFDTIKRRLQLSGEMGNPKYKCINDCIKYIYKNHGIRGFYRGLISCYLKIIPANGIFFLMIELFKL